MFTRSVLTSLFIAVVLGLTAHAQVAITVVTRTPMPGELSAWRRDHSLLQVSLINPPGAPAYPDARISFEVRNAESGAMVAHSKDEHPAMPRVAIPAGPSVTLRNGADLVDERAVDIDARLRDVARATNALPEGRYEFCVRLLDKAGREIPSTGLRCGSFAVAQPTPPVLLEPIDGAELGGPALPRFSWLPSTPVPATPLRYQLRIVPIYPGQSSEGALERNTPIITRVTMTTWYQYAPSDPPLASFPSADAFAWQVSLSDEHGTHAAASSAIRTFSFGVYSLPEGLLFPRNAYTIIGGPIGNLAGNGPPKKGGKKGGGGDLGNLGAITGDCDKPHSVGVKLTFPKVMGFNTFPAEILEIGGVDNTIADVTSDGESITVKCKRTGTFTITVKLRALPLGLAPMTDVYTGTITIICNCGNPKPGGGKGGPDNGNGGKDNGNGGKDNVDGGKGNGGKDAGKGGNNGGKGGNNGGKGGNNGGPKVPASKRPPCENAILVDCKWFGQDERDARDKYANDHQNQHGTAIVNGVEYEPTAVITSEGFGSTVCLWWCPKVKSGVVGGGANGGGATGGGTTGGGTTGGGTTGGGTTGGGTTGGGTTGGGTIGGGATGTTPCVENYTIPVCIGQTITPFHPLNPAFGGNSNPGVASGSINAGGDVEITGLSEGTTTITVDMDGYNEQHQRIRCKLVITVVVKRCDPNSSGTGATEGTGTGGTGSTGGTSSGGSSSSGGTSSGSTGLSGGASGGPSGGVNGGGTAAGGTATGGGANLGGANNDCSHAYSLTVCVGQTMTPFQPKNPKVTGNTNPAAASGTINAAGQVSITGLAPGTTTITVEFDSYNERHELVRCRLIITVTVKNCDPKNGSGGSNGTPPPHDSFFDVFQEVSGTGRPADPPRNNGGKVSPKGAASDSCDKLIKELERGLKSAQYDSLQDANRVTSAAKDSAKRADALARAIEDSTTNAGALDQARKDSAAAETELADARRKYDDLGTKWTGLKNNAGAKEGLARDLAAAQAALKAAQEKLRKIKDDIRKLEDDRTRSAGVRTKLRREARDSAKAAAAARDAAGKSQAKAEHAAGDLAKARENCGK